jgi:hypothetical protein
MKRIVKTGFSCTAILSAGFLAAAALFSLGSGCTLIRPVYAPTGLHVAGKTTTSISIAWDAMPEAIHYRVHHATFSPLTAGPSPAESDNDNALSERETKETSFTISSLEPDTVYYIAVGAVNLGGESPLCTELPVRTEGIQPAMVTGLTAVSTDTGEVTLDWDPMEGIGSFQIEYNLVSSPSNPARTTAHAVPFVLDGLNSGMTYAFRVAALSGTMIGPNAEVGCYVR